MIQFSPLKEFETSDTLAALLEEFFLTTGGDKFIQAMREYALGLAGNQEGTIQDGARAVVDKMLDLTLSRRNEKKEHTSPKAPTSKRLLRKEPPPPALRGKPDPKPEPEEPK